MANPWSELSWTSLLLRIRSGKCTPFLGAGACHQVLPLGKEIARAWAHDYGYPLKDTDNLIHVAQFLAVQIDHMLPKQLLLERLGAAGTPDFDEADEPHAVLADLGLPVYVTTNYDRFMYQALDSRPLKGSDREPQRAFCQWNRDLKKENTVFSEDPSYDPSPEKPLIFHMHGYDGLAESLVLTEDDYLDFLVNMSEDPNLLPPRVQAAFTDTTLLFLGYAITDWNFRVLFRSLVRYLAKARTYAHVSVQLVPGAGEIAEDEQKRAEAYLNSYFDKLDIHMYWGTCREFAAELRTRWEAA